LGNSDGHLSVSPPPSRRAAEIVEQVLAGSLPQWEHLREHLGLLAEASPEAFLHRIEQCLAQEPNQQTPQESPAPSLILAISSALGLLALDVDLLPKVALVLAKLFESENLSKADRKHSQPLKVLQEVFHPQLPKTNATSEERLAALAPLIQQAPTAAWALLLTLLGGRGMVLLTCHAPRSCRCPFPPCAGEFRGPRSTDSWSSFCPGPWNWRALTAKSGPRSWKSGHGFRPSCC
jgi:hypothetical protein